MSFNFNNLATISHFESLRLSLAVSVKHEDIIEKTVLVKKLEQKIQEQNDTIDNPNNSLKTKNKELEDIYIKNENYISIRSVSGRGGQCDIQYTTYIQTERQILEKFI